MAYQNVSLIRLLINDGSYYLRQNHFMSQITSVTPRTLTTGITGHYVHGDKSTLGLVILEKGSSVPPHSHSQEQITYILEGHLQMVIDGKDCLLEPGMYYVIPSNIVH